MTRTCASTPAPLGAQHLASRRSTVGAGLVLAAVLAVTGCGQQTPQAGSGTTAAAADGDGARSQGSDGAATAPRVTRLATGEAGPELTCPSDERSMMVADPVHGVEGAATPEDALVREDLEDGESLLVDERGSTAWVLRADGTARARIGLSRVDGWLVDERMACG